jgi:hypothetical protein
MTDFEIECQVLSGLWMNYRTVEGFQEFIEYNDIGLPLAHYVADGLIRKSALEAVAINYISDTYALLFEMLGLPLSYECQTIDDLLAFAEDK